MIDHRGLVFDPNCNTYTVALVVAMSTLNSIAGFFLFSDLPAGLIAVIISLTRRLTTQL
jgi:hypothetical protein